MCSVSIVIFNGSGLLNCRSMVRAVKGMIAEKSGIFMSFIMCLIAFQLMTLAVTWVSSIYL